MVAYCMSCMYTQVIDILIKLVISTFENQVNSRVENTCAFLDSRFASLMCRNHPKFKKPKSKIGFTLPKSLVECLSNSSASLGSVTRFYLPFNISKRHWICICLDFSASKAYILDCNPGVTTLATLHKELLPITELFPHLLKQCGVSVEGVDKPLVVERMVGIATNTNPGDAGIAATLLIQSHAFFGPESCTSITPSVIPDEAHRAAVMIYEFHVKL